MILTKTDEKEITSQSKMKVMMTDKADMKSITDFFKAQRDKERVAKEPKAKIGTTDDETEEILEEDSPTCIRKIHTSEDATMTNIDKEEKEVDAADKAMKEGKKDDLSAEKKKEDMEELHRQATFY